MAYTPPDVTEVNFQLSTGYTAPTSSSVDFEMSEEVSGIWGVFEESYSITLDVLAVIEEEWDLPFPPVLLVEEIYSIALPIQNVIEEIYTIYEPVMLVFSEIYGLKMCVTLVEWYSDAYIPVSLTNEYYDDTVSPISLVNEYYDDTLVSLAIFNELLGDASTPVGFNELLYDDVQAPLRVYKETYDDVKYLTKYYDESYGDAVRSIRSITEPFDFNSGAVGAVSLPWNISSISVGTIFEESYALENMDKVSASFSMPYYLVAETSIESTIEVSVSIDGVPIDFISIDISAGMDKYVIMGEIELATQADYLNSPLLGEAECTIDGTTFVLFIETRGKTKTNAAGSSWTIGLISPTAKLDSPYSKTMVESFTDGIWASELVQQMADYQGVTVDWQILDWSIPNYAISANDETPLAIIKKVVNAVGAIIQTKPNGDMLIISKYPISPNLWESSIPSTIFSSETDIISIDDDIGINEGKNAFLITDQGSSAADITLEEIDEDETTKIIRGFRVPFDAGPFDLVTSGGPSISVVKDVNYIEASIPIDFDPDGEEWEYVEFIDWVGTTKYPIYDVLEWEWIAENMGAFQLSEDGTLTALVQSDTLKESLLRIKYTTKYWKWTVKGPLKAYAQVYVPEIETT